MKVQSKKLKVESETTLKIEQFEDLIAWQKARELTRDIYEITRSDGFIKDHGLAGQIQRAAVSIMSNIAEGFERNSPNEFRRFLAIAKASCGEVRSQLYVAYDVGYINQSEFNRLLTQAMEVSRVIGGLLFSIVQKQPNNSIG
ncbi:MAG TPA: four helix bundle protein [Oceanobacillus sp.]|nr:four helix bundle protein [Oceanobacillus sp.]